MARKKCFWKAAQRNFNKIRWEEWNRPVIVNGVVMLKSMAPKGKVK